MTTSTLWTRETTALRCPRCKASPGARCRTSSGRYATAPHEGRLIPSFTCPRCGTVDTNPTNAAFGYCSTCHDWTGVTTSSTTRAAQDELAL